MQTRYQIPLYTALAIMAVRFLVYIMGLQYRLMDEAFLFMSLAVLPALTIYAIWPRGVEMGFIDDLKNALRYTGLYTLAFVVLNVLFFHLVDTTYFAHRHQLLLERELLSNPELDPNEIAARIQSFFSLRNFAVLMLVGFMLMSVFYAVLFSAMKRLISHRANR